MLWVLWHKWRCWLRGMWRGSWRGDKAGRTKQKWKGRWEKMTEHQCFQLPGVAEDHLCFNTWVFSYFHWKGPTVLHFSQSSGITFIWHKSHDKSSVWWQSLCLSDMCAAYPPPLGVLAILTGLFQMSRACVTLSIHSKVVNHGKTFRRENILS